MESAITTRGRITIPKAIREHLRLKPGGRVKFFMHPDGSVVILPRLPVASARGMVKSHGRVTIEDMNEAIAAGAAEGISRRRRR